MKNYSIKEINSIDPNKEYFICECCRHCNSIIIRTENMYSIDDIDIIVAKFLMLVGIAFEKYTSGHFCFDHLDISTYTSILYDEDRGC